MLKARLLDIFYNFNNSLGPDFNRMVAVSVILHIMVFSLAIFFQNTPHSKLIYTSIYTVNLVESPRSRPGYTRVVKKRPTAPKTTKRKVQTITVKKKTTSMKSIKPKKMEAAIPIKKEEAFLLSDTLERINENVKRRDEESLIQTSIDKFKRNAKEAEGRRWRIEELKRALAEGQRSIDIGSPTSQVSGAVKKGLFDMEFKAYYQTIWERISSLWIYTGPVKEREFTTIGIRIGDSGEIIERWVERRSSETELNESALMAIDMATKDRPFPSPPEGIDREIAIRFCPAGCPKK
ncbi:MAG: TonB C-terminal domain-containing protein [Thermodesulfobacteriota bacterium]